MPTKHHESNGIYSIEQQVPATACATIEQAYAHIGFGRANMKIIFFCGLVLMSVMSESTGMSVILPAAHCDLELTDIQKGYLNSVGFLGIAVPSMLWGYVADTQGRRVTMLYTLAAAFACSMISLFSYNFWVFLVARFFTSFFISGPSATVFAWVGEFHTEQNRAAIIQWSSCFFGVSYTLIPAIAWLVLPYTWSWTLPFFGYAMLPWRLLILLYSLPGLIGAIGIFTMPESPKFLSSQKRDKQALAAIHWLWTENTGNSIATFPYTALVPVEPDRLQPNKVHGIWEFFKSIGSQVLPLFRRPYVWQYSICCFIMMSIYASSGGLALWFPDIVNRLSNNNLGTPDTLCRLLEVKPAESGLLDATCDATISSNMYIGTMLIGVFYFLGFAITALAMPKLGSGLVMAICLFGSATAGITLQFIVEPYTVIVVFGVFLFMSGICISLISGVAVNIIPTAYRSMSVAIMFMFGRTGAVFTTTIIGQIIYDGYCLSIFAVFVTAILISGLLNFFLPWKIKSAAH